jgi:hypothetical protein
MRNIFPIYDGKNPFDPQIKGFQNPLSDFSIVKRSIPFIKQAMKNFVSSFNTGASDPGGFAYR